MFPTTSWTMVLQAAGPEASRTALEQLCAAYWKPVYVFIRKETGDSEEAKDLTQAFFTRILEKHDLLPPDPEIGRFRHYLLASVRHFLSNQRDRARAQKRGGGRPTLLLDSSAVAAGQPVEAVEHLTPERVFEKQWVLVLLERALNAVRLEFDAGGKSQQFEALRPYLTGDFSSGHYKDLGAKLGMSEGGVKSAVHRLRRRFGNSLRAEIAHTVADPTDIEDELRYLFMVLSS
ncbi:MAG: sigma-70 family RNA polymerase sigma factor [Bryobacteraceae bacterium]